MTDGDQNSSGRNYLFSGSLIFFGSQDPLEIKATDDLWRKMHIPHLAYVILGSLDSNFGIMESYILFNGKSFGVLGGGVLLFCWGFVVDFPPLLMSIFLRSCLLFGYFHSWTVSGTDVSIISRLLGCKNQAVWGEVGREHSFPIIELFCYSSWRLSSSNAIYFSIISQSCGWWGQQEWNLFKRNSLGRKTF